MALGEKIFASFDSIVLTIQLFSASLQRYFQLPNTSVARRLRFGGCPRISTPTLQFPPAHIHLPTSHTTRLRPKNSYKHEQLRKEVPLCLRQRLLECLKGSRGSGPQCRSQPIHLTPFDSDCPFINNLFESNFKLQQCKCTYKARRSGQRVSWRTTMLTWNEEVGSIRSILS